MNFEFTTNMKLLHNFATRLLFKPCIIVPRGIPCQGIHNRSNSIMQGERGDSVEKHFIGFYQMYLIKSFSGLLNQKAWKATRRLAHWAEYLKLNFCSYSVSTKSFCLFPEYPQLFWWIMTSWQLRYLKDEEKSSVVGVPSTGCTFLLTQLD